MKDQLYDIVGQWLRHSAANQRRRFAACASSSTPASAREMATDAAMPRPPPRCAPLPRASEAWPRAAARRPGTRAPVQVRGPGLVPPVGRTRNQVASKTRECGRVWSAEPRSPSGPIKSGRMRAPLRTGRSCASCYCSSRRILSRLRTGAPGMPVGFFGGDCAGVG